MWNKMLRVSEWLVSIFSVALLIYISLVLVRPHAAQLVNRSTTLRPGQTVPISGVAWNKSSQTLIFALQTTCHYCAESAPFYKELLKRQGPGAWQALAVLPQPVQKSAAYMQAEGYSVSDVRQMNLGLIGVAGTPTLLLVDQKGRLEKEWVGRLDPSGENEVAEALGVGKLVQDEPRVTLAAMGPTGGRLTEGSGATDAVPAQTPQPPGTRTVRLQHRMADDPVRIVQVLNGTTDVTPTGRDPVTGAPYRPWLGKPFQAGDDWLKNLAFVVKNLSSKEIIAADFDVSFPETGNGTPNSPVIMYMVMLGQEPENALVDWRTGRKRNRPPTSTLSLLPDKELRVALAPYYDADIKTPIEANQAMSTITTCTITPSMIYFADGTRWNGSIFEKPDPITPGKYMRITPDEFRSTTTVN